MNLTEAEGKQLFKQYNIPIPRGYLVSQINQVKQPAWKDSVVKAQIHTGKRGKAGGIKFATADLKKVCKHLLGATIRDEKVHSVLVEEKIAVKKEYYLSLLVDRSSRDIMVVFSEKGGVDIGSLAEKEPNAIKKGPFSKLARVVKDKKIQAICKKMHKLMTQMDCLLVEINPLFLTANGLVAGDAKVELDNNALFRHPDFEKKYLKQLTPAEQKALRAGIHYVPLDGDIGIIGNGAGLVMVTMDLVHHYGRKPANFLDVGGGADAKAMQKAMEIVCSKKIKGLLINIFGGITHCDEIAKGIVAYKKKNNVRFPIAMRMIGTNEQLAKRMLAKEGIIMKDSIEECAKTIT